MANKRKQSFPNSSSYRGILKGIPTERFTESEFYYYNKGAGKGAGGLYRASEVKSDGGGPPNIPPANRSYAYVDPPEKGRPAYSVNDKSSRGPDLYSISQGVNIGKNIYTSLSQDETQDTMIRVTPENMSSVMDAIKNAVEHNYAAEVTISYPSVAYDEDKQDQALIAGKLRPIVLRSVISSNVKRIGMDSLDDTVYVQFKGMGHEVYYYENGGIDLYHSLITAPSHGHAIWEFIRWVGDPYNYGVTPSPLEPDAVFVYN